MRSLDLAAWQPRNQQDRWVTRSQGDGVIRENPRIDLRIPSEVYPTCDTMVVSRNWGAREIRPITCAVWAKTPAIPLVETAREGLPEGLAYCELKPTFPQHLTSSSQPAQCLAE